MTADDMPIRIAHSPDADDAFMFCGLATGRVASEGLEVEHVLHRTLELVYADGNAEAYKADQRFQQETVKPQSGYGPTGRMV
jgi:hypothetical protein